MVLSNTDCPPCSGYIRILENQYRHLAKEVLFNIIDVSLPKNQWYQQWVCSATLPTTCIFSKKGVLQAIVSGTAKQCFNCIESSVKGDTDCSGYLYSKHYQASGNVIQTLNDVLECKLRLDKGENSGKELTESLNRIQYPYNFYLKSLSEQQKGNREEAIYWAKKLLEFNDAYYYRLYGEIYLQARYIIDPDYDPTKIAILSVEKERILEDCEVNQPKRFGIVVTNTGLTLLEIADISVSCSCLKLLSERMHRIDSGEYQTIDFEFTADKEGELYREITFASNASNALETVKIKAIVK
jgi:hypothetical protein